MRAGDSVHAAIALGADLRTQEQVEPFGGLPIERGVGHVLGRHGAGDRQALAGTGGLLALGPGVVAAQLQVVQQVDVAGQFRAAPIGPESTKAALPAC